QGAILVVSFKIVTGLTVFRTSRSTGIAFCVVMTLGSSEQFLDAKYVSDFDSGGGFMPAPIV
ncbi:hypothetical protein, partial [Aeromonas caviae]|uniref:hypothetical protein n=1 Tax=Aeromonas caviae TaxID=648 RepID=UPI001FFD40DD